MQPTPATIKLSELRLVLSVAKLIERVKCRHGLREVRATWGIGPKALLAEPRYVLCGGAA
jgi:hypothetical protein